MRDRASSDRPGAAGQQREARAATREIAAPAPTLRSAPTPLQALALQRLAGNRVTSRMLARWTKHPDPEQKGVMVPDIVSAEFLRLNPPKNE